MDNAVNKRFTTLRSKLDGLEFTQTLHPDSVPLVETLLEKYMKTSLQLHNLKKTSSNSMNETTHSYSNKGEISNNTSYVNKSEEQTSFSQHKMNLLLKQLSETQKKLEDKELQLQLLKDGTDGHGRIKEVRDKYDNKINDLLRQIQSFQKKQKDNDEQKSQMQQIIQTLSKQLENIKDELESKQRILLNQTRQRITVRKQYDDILNSTQSNDNRRIQQLNSIIDRKKARVEQLEEVDIMNKSKLADLIKQLEFADVEHKQLLMQNKNLNLRIQSLKDQNSDLSKTISKLKLATQQLNRQLDSLKRHKNSLQQELQIVQTSEIQRNFTIQTKEKARDKLNLLYEESQKELREKKEECKILEEEKDQLLKNTQKLQIKLKELSNKNVVLNSNIDTLQEQLNFINSKYSQKLKELKEVEVQKLQLQRISKDAEPMQLKYFQLQSKYNQLLTSGGASHQFQKKNRQQFEHQIKILQEQIKIMKEREEQSIIRSQKLSNQQKRLQVLINHGNKQIQMINSQKQSLLKQNKELKQQINSVSLKAHSNKTQGLKHIEKINSNEILIQDLRNNLDAESYKIHQILEENKLLQMNLKKSEQKNRQLYQDNVQLKSICENLQQNKNQLWGKLKRTHSERELVESQKVKKSEEYLLLKKKVQSLAQDLQQKERAILQIDELRDNYEKEYNRMAEQNQEMKSRVTKLQDDNRRCQQSLGENQLSIYNYESHLNSLQSERDNFQKLKHKANMEINNLNIQVNKLRSQIQRQQNQSALLRMNNKEISKQLQMYQAAKNSLEQGINNKLNEINQSRTNLQIIKLDNQQLSQDCTELNSEVKRLEGLVLELQKQNHSMYDILHAKDAEIKEFQDVKIKSRYKQIQYLEQIKSFQKQLSILSQQVNMKDQDFRRAAIQRDMLKSEVAMSRRQPQIDWKSVMEERLMQTQCNLDIKKREVDNHILENRKLVKAIEQQRVINFRLTKQIQELKSCSHLGTPIRNLIGESIDESQLQNSSIHYNNGEVNIVSESFQNNDSVSSKKVMNKLQQIKQRYMCTVSRVQSIKNKKS